MSEINVRNPTADDSTLAALQVAAVWLRLQRAMLRHGSDGPSPLIAAEDLAWSIRIQIHVDGMRSGGCKEEKCPGCKLAAGKGKAQL